MHCSERIYSNMASPMPAVSAEQTDVRWEDYSIPKTKRIYAKAMYDNIAESPDELAFRRGDILTVVEKDPDNLVGWWLCSLRGRQGICPGNRLEEIQPYDSGCFSMSSVSSPSPSSIGSSTMSLVNLSLNNSPSLTSQQDLIYENTHHHMTLQKQGKRRSWQYLPNQVVIPKKHGDVYLYLPLSLPPPHSAGPIAGRQIFNVIYQNTSTGEGSETYDVPRASLRVQSSMSNHSAKSNLPTPTRVTAMTAAEECYDFPRPLSQCHQNLTPSSSNSSLLTSDSFSLSSSTRSSLANMPDYDIPRRNPVPCRVGTPSQGITTNLINTSHVTSSSTYDFPQTVIQKSNRMSRELPLELGSALETLGKLETDATSAITRLLSYVGPNWRTRERLEPILMDIKLAAVRLRNALHDLANFGEGALGNTTKSDDKVLSLKLKPLVQALRVADKLVNEASKTLDERGWSLEILSRPEVDNNIRSSSLPPDSLDQLVACAKTLTEDVRQTASFIQGNATLLFKRSSLILSTPTTPNNNGGGEWLEDCDYVSLESKEASAKKNAELRDALYPHLQKDFDHAIKQADSAAVAVLDQTDKSLLEFYAAQTVTHIEYLILAIDGLLRTVEHNQPPKQFLAHGKFVILSTHNLVNIGDMVHRNVTQKEVKARILLCANALNDGMKTCVAKTKKAAQNFPSVTAVQEMVDSVIDISQLAKDLKIAMLQSFAQG